MRVHMLIAQENKNNLMGTDENGNFLFGNVDQNGTPAVRRIQPPARKPQPTATERERNQAQQDFINTGNQLSIYEKQNPHVTTEAQELAADPDYKKISAITDPEEQKSALESSDLDPEKKQRIARVLEHEGMTSKHKSLENNLKVKWNQVYDPQGKVFKDVPKPTKPTKGSSNNPLEIAGAKKDAAGRAFILKNPEANMTAVYAGKVSPEDQEKMAAKYPGKTAPEKLKAFQADMKKATDAYTYFYSLAQAKGTPKTDPNQQGGKNTKKTKTLSPQDQQAVDWARANPNDPRSAKILKLHNLAQ